MKRTRSASLLPYLRLDSRFVFLGRYSITVIVFRGLLVGHSFKSSHTQHAILKTFALCLHHRSGFETLVGAQAAHLCVSMASISFAAQLGAKK